MAFLYPWGNTQQLNLDWILQKIKELEAGSGGADLNEVAEALLAASYSAQAYDRSDIVFHDGKLYRANQAIPAPGEAWTPAHWDEILLGDTVSNLVQYVAALSNDQIVNSSNVSGTHTSDALDTLKNAIDAITLDSDSVSNESQVTGNNVTDALDNLNGAINAITALEQTAINIADSTHNSTLTGTRYKRGGLYYFDLQLTLNSDVAHGAVAFQTSNLPTQTTKCNFLTYSGKFLIVGSIVNSGLTVRVYNQTDTAVFPSGHSVTFGAVSFII